MSSQYTENVDEDTKGNVLVVDDTPANLRLLSRLLTENGYKVRPVPSGKLALDAVKAVPPDIILLDIRMLEMDGYAVCRHLKAEKSTSEIPVIFISALHDMQDKVKGFEMGGIDYITKPFQEEEVLIRLETHITLRRQQQQLREQYDELRKLEIMRETLANMIVHDLNNALQAILGYAEMLCDTPDTLQEEDILFFGGSIISSARTTVEMIRAILDVSKMEANEIQINKTSFCVAELLSIVKKELSCHLAQRDLTLDIKVPTEIPPLQADQELFRRILVNIIANAVRFSPKSGAISLSVEPEAHSLRFTVVDQGPGIPAEYKERIFEKYGQVESRKTGRKYSTGLGLTFCKMAVEAHGGKIGVADNEDQGSLFWFELPNRVPNGA